jgi:hypothetical protein
VAVSCHGDTPCKIDDLRQTGQQRLNLKLIRSAIRGLLAAAGGDAATLRGLLARDDDFANAGKPACDYDDRAAREALVDALARDVGALLGALHGRELAPVLARAAALLATVTGQDLGKDDDGVFRIARRVARDRVVSTVDPEARHGHKTSARGFDGYKGHIAIGPDAELITAVGVTVGNAGDAAAAADLLAADLPVSPDGQAAGGTEDGAGLAARAGAPAAADEPAAGPSGPEEDPLSVYGDAAYGSGELLDDLERAGADVKCKVQPPVAGGGRFTKDAFSIGLHAGQVACPAGQAAPLRPSGDGRIASFGAACAGCPLAAQCTTAKAGRSIWAGPCEEQLARRGSGRPARAGRPATGRPGPRSSARSAT